MRLVIFLNLIVLSVVGCGKKDDDSTATSSDSASSVVAAYTTLNTNVQSLAVIKATSLALNETWTTNDWGTTARFNCFGSCSGSIHAKQYVADALNPLKSGPVGTVASVLQTFCLVGVVLDPSDMTNGIPNDVTDKAITFTDEKVTKLTTATASGGCGFPAATAEDVKKVTMTFSSAAANNDNYDKLLTFKMSGGGESSTYQFYYKNSGGKIGMGEFTVKGSATSGTITRTIMVRDSSTKSFRMEYYNRTFPVPAAGTAIASAGSYQFYRGFYDEATGEKRFFSNMGNSYYQINNTMLSTSGNESEKTAGAFISRNAQDTTTLAGAFVCFNAADGTFVNNSGCTENAAQNRKSTWTSASSLFATVTGKGFSDWGGSPVTVPAFDATTMYTIEPNYK